MQPTLIALGVAAVAGWLWFLARGRAPGTLKKAALRASLLALVFALVLAAQRRGVFARSSAGFQLALLLALLCVSVGYLYLTRFCPACGRMVRDLKPPDCPRCHALLPRHGMTRKMRRLDDHRLWDPRARRARRAPQDGPQA